MLAGVLRREIPTQRPRWGAATLDSYITIPLKEFAVDPEIAALLPLLEADTANRLAQLESDLPAVRRARAEMVAPVDFADS